MPRLEGLEEAGLAQPYAYTSELEQTQLLTLILANKIKVR